MTFLHIVLFSLCICIPLSAFGQRDAELDSLFRAHNMQSKHDTVKFKWLIKTAMTLANQIPSKGLYCAEKALTMAQNNQNKYWEAQAIYAKGANKLAIGSNKEALPLLTQSLELFEHLGKKIDMAQNTLSICRAYASMTNTDETKKYLDKAAALFADLNDEKGIAECINMEGVWYKLKWDLTTAGSKYEKALAVFSRLNDSLNLQKTYSNLSGVASGLGDHHKAIAYCEKALAINTAMNNQNLVILNYSNIGWGYKSLGELTTALTYYLKSLALSEALNNKDLMAYNYDKIGGVYRELADYPKAFDYYQKAIAINEQLDDKNAIAINNGNIGNTFFLQGNYTQSLLYQEKALLIFEQIKNKYSSTATYLNIGNVYYRLKNHEKALVYYKKGKQLSEEMKAKNFELSSLASIGLVYQDAADDVLIKEGIAPENRFAKVLEIQERSLVMAQELKGLRDIVVVWENISTTHEKNGNYTKALDAYKQYIIFRDSMAGDAVKKQITRKEIQYEYDKKETALKFEAQLTASQLEKQKLLSIEQAQELQLKNQSLSLKEQALLMSNKEKDIQHLAFLKEQAEKEQKEQALGLAEKDKQIQETQLTTFIKEKALQIQLLANKNTLLGFLLSGFASIALGFVALYFWQRQKRLKVEAARQRQFTQQLLEQTETERGRIAIDLHDSISHELLSLKRGINAHNTEGVHEKIDGIIDDIRQISRNLHPVLLDKIGLKLSIENLCEQYGEHETLFVSPDIQYDKQLPKPTELQVFRIIQEALNNTVKYANANASSIKMSQNTEGVLLEIKDNGKGFNVKKALANGKSFGLHSIVQRSKAIGGTARIQASEVGTTIRITIPSAPNPKGESPITNN